MSIEQDNQSRTPEIIHDSVAFRECVVEGYWDRVIARYKDNTVFHMKKISKSRGTALHVAVNDGNEEVVERLVGEIINHEGERAGRYGGALRSKNERGDTPLHLAASRGLPRMCECIIGKNGERKQLIHAENEQGETPLFMATLTGQTETFVYLHDVCQEVINADDLTTSGSASDYSILHCAIRREFFDLAIIIMHCFSDLGTMSDRNRVPPLEVLATRPSAFKSGTNLSWWTKIIYKCIAVEDLNAKKAMASYLKKKDESKASEQKRLSKVEQQSSERDQHKTKEKDQSQISIHLLPELQTYPVSENEDKKAADILVPPNWATCLQLAYITIRFASSTLGLSALLDRVGKYIEGIRKIKQKHIWGRQLLKAFMETPYESYTGIGGQPFDEDDEEDDYGFQSREVFAFNWEINEPASSTEMQQENAKMESVARKEENLTVSLAEGKNDIVVAVKELKNAIVKAVNELPTKIQSAFHDTASERKIGDKKDTPLLAAARNGIVEIVYEIQSKIRSALHDTTPDKENVLLVAVKNRQPHVVQTLKNNLEPKLFGSLISAVDNKENTVLHLAAGTLSNNGETWQISGAAMQMMWDIKWYEYIKGLVPEHFNFRTNKDEKTAGEIFKKEHKELVKVSSEWLKDTSESCSVVAALIAGVSFATSSNFPGGTQDTGKPTLEGQPAFDTFAISSLIGLFFSVTALIMFLSILTSRKEAINFRKDMPLKLLLGLSSLFMSIASMFVSFCSGHFFVLKDKYKNTLFPLYAATCLPLTFYAVAQFPLYADLVKAIVTKVPQSSGKGSDL